MGSVFQSIERGQFQIESRTTQFHNVLLCLYVADPAIFLASNNVLGTLFSSESSLFIQLKNKHF